MSTTDAKGPYHDKMISLGFRKGVSLETVQGLINSPKMSRFAIEDSEFDEVNQEVFGMIFVETGKEQEYIDYLKTLPELEMAERIPTSLVGLAKP